MKTQQHKTHVSIILSYIWVPGWWGSEYCPKLKSFWPAGQSHLWCYCTACATIYIYIYIYMGSQLKRGSLWPSWSRVTSAGVRPYTVAIGVLPRGRQGYKMSPRVMGNFSRVATVFEHVAVAETRVCPSCCSSHWTRCLAAASSSSARAIRCKCPRVACSCSCLCRSCRRPISPSIFSNSWSRDRLADCSREEVWVTEEGGVAAGTSLGGDEGFSASGTVEAASTSKRSSNDTGISPDRSEPIDIRWLIIPATITATLVCSLGFCANESPPAGGTREPPVQTQLLDWSSTNFL